MYLLHHEEIESLAKNIPGVQRIRFFMTFGQSYLTHMKCLENVGMLSTEPVELRATRLSHPVPESPAARPGHSGPPHRRQDQHRLHLHREEGRKGKDRLSLQHLRPPGVL